VSGDKFRSKTVKYVEGVWRFSVVSGNTSALKLTVGWLFLHFIRCKLIFTSPLCSPRHPPNLLVDIYRTRSLFCGNIESGSWCQL